MSKPVQSFYPPAIGSIMRPSPLAVLVAMFLAGGANAETLPDNAPGYSGFPFAGPSEAILPLMPQGNDECPLFVFRHGFEPGHLAQNAPGAPMTYITSGGYSVKIDRHTLTVTDPIGFNSVQHWGDPHENLNGKHIKDWAGAPGWSGVRRSLMLGDGTKVTMTAEGPHGVVLLTSIYDTEQNVQIHNSTNTILHHSLKAADTLARDEAQYDGETALFETSMITAIGSYTNIYNEDADFNVTHFNTPLGTTGGCANPNQVNDLFDDPRLGHT